MQELGPTAELQEVGAMSIGCSSTSAPPLGKGATGQGKQGNITIYENLFCPFTIMK